MSMSRNPGTGKTLADHGFDDTAAIDTALDRTVTGRQRGTRMPVGSRAAVLPRIRAALRSEMATPAVTTTRHAGKPIAQ
jgi:acyl-CoA reductase-like NAD-dependent aldehyde dehydrogenase